MDIFFMFGRGGIFVYRVYLNYNGVFGKNIVFIIEYCIIEKWYIEILDRFNIKSCYLSILNLFNNKIFGDRKLKIRVIFFIEMGRKYFIGFYFFYLYCILFNKCWFIFFCRF